MRLRTYYQPLLISVTLYLFYDLVQLITTDKDITFPTKVHQVKVMVFPVVIYGYKSWTIKEAEYLRMDAFEL